MLYLFPGTLVRSVQAYDTRVDWCEIRQTEDQYYVIALLWNLKKIIQMNIFIKTETEYSAIKIPRRNIFWGNESDLHYPDYVLRFAKKTAINWPCEIHSQPIIDGKIYTIPKKHKKLAFMHYTCKSPAVLLNTINNYTDKELEKLIKSDKKNFNMFFSIWRSFFLILEKFFVKGGYKNGIDGLIMCIFFGIYKFMMYTKYYVYLKEKNKK